MMHDLDPQPANPAPATSAPTSPEALLAELARLGIEATTCHHPAVFTVEESQGLALGLPGAHTKNLFVKDKKGRFFLVSALKDARIDLKRLYEVIGATGRLSFGSEGQLWQHLGVRPGSVTAFSVINDHSAHVTMVLDAGLMAHDSVNFHPLVNTMTTRVTCEDLLIFLCATGHEPLIVELPSPPDDTPPGEA